MFVVVRLSFFSSQCTILYVSWWGESIVQSSGKNQHDCVSTPMSSFCFYYEVLTLSHFDEKTNQDVSTLQRQWWAGVSYRTEFCQPCRSRKVTMMRNLRMVVTNRSVTSLKMTIQHWWPNIGTPISKETIILVQLLTRAHLNKRWTKPFRACRLKMFVLLFRSQEIDLSILLAPSTSDLSSR